MNGKRSKRLGERSMKEIGEKDLSEEKERREVRMLITMRVIETVDKGIRTIILAKLMIMMMIVMTIMIIARTPMIKTLAQNIIMIALEEITEATRTIMIMSSSISTGTIINQSLVNS